MKFKYFRDPDNFAYKTEKAKECSICQNVGIWFDASCFYGENEIESICDDCLLAGKLKELGIETNEAFDGEDEDIETITYKTPVLPTWQGREWPFVDGQYCIFERMASKEDFANKDEFINSFLEDDRNTTELDWLWENLTDKRIRNHQEGNFNVSVYLFTLDGKKVCTWDAS